MVSPINSETSGFSRTEWGSLPIQERIRAMAEASPVGKLPDSAVGEISVNSDSSSKRSSVIEMWRKREESATCSSSSSAAGQKNVSSPRAPFNKTNSDRCGTTSTITDSQRRLDNLEEKKEPMPEEDSGHSGSYDDSRVTKKFLSITPANSAGKWANAPLSPPPQSHPLPSPKSSIHRPAVVSPSTPVGVRPTASNRESTYKFGDKPANSSSVTTATASPSTVGSPAHSTTGSPFPKALDTKSPAAKREAVSATSVEPITPDNSEKPAFSDLKSRWAKFGAQKIQAREGSKIPAKVTPKLLPDSSGRNPKSQDQIHGDLDDESSIDLDRSSRGRPPAPGSTVLSTGRPHIPMGGSATESLQQPVLDVDDDGFPKMVGNQSPFISQQSQSQKLAEGKPMPSKKAATCMYVKDRTNSMSMEGSQDDSKSGNENGCSPSRMNPRQFAQRKLLLDKHRRRKKALGGTSSSSENSPVSMEKYDAFDNEFGISNANRQPQASAEVVANANTKAPSPLLVVGSKIPMKTLMAYGADEEEFICSEFGPGQIPRDFGFKSLLTSASHSLHETKLEDRRYSDPLPAHTIAIDDRDSGVGSLTSKSSIASRAQKNMRDKCFKTRCEPSGINEPPGRYSESFPERPYTKPFSNFDGDEMMILEQEHATRGTTRGRAVARVVHSRRQSDVDAQGPNQPSDDSESVRSMSTISNIMSTITSFSENTNNKGRTPRGITAEAIVTDKFVSESNANVDAFAASFQSLSLGQLAKDLTEEASTVFEGVDFKKMSSDLNRGVLAASKSLNANMSAASKSLHKIVGQEANSKKRPVARGGGAASPVEEVAIEVEYVEDPE